MDLKEEDILGDGVSEHWYYRAKLNAMLRYLDHLDIRNILDVGAGSGFFSKGLLRKTDAQSALCVDPYYPHEHDDCIDGKPLRFRNECGPVDTDLVLMMDVLEHVDDDVGLLREYVELTPSGSRFLITVPAFNFLWSEHDTFLEHKRRYQLQSAAQTVQNAGLVMENASYYYGLVFPLAAATRLLGRLKHGSGELSPRSQLKRHAPVTNSILSAICKADLALLKVNKLAGLSVFCLARKP